MKKVLFLVSFIIGLLVNASPLYAQNVTQPVTINDIKDGRASMPIIPPTPIESFLGQTVSYSVTLRGNGEAVVILKSFFSNTDKKPIDTVTLTIPTNITAKYTAAFQVISQPRCLIYAPTPASGPKPLIAQNAGNQSIAQPPCQQYEDIGVNNYAYNSLYQKINYDLKNNQLVLHLSKPVGENQNGSYFVYLRAMGYAKSNIFGAYDFSFETFKINDNTNSLTLGVNVDDNYILRDDSGKINYQVQSSVTTTPLPSKMADTAIRSTQLDQLYNNIGQGAIMKTANNLAPNETYKLKGSYADASWKLYVNEILIGILVVILLIVAIILIAKAIVNRIHKKIEVNSKNKVVSNHKGIFFASLGISFAGTFLLFLYNLGIYIVSNNLDIISGNLVGIFAIFALSTGIYIFFLFVPAVVMGLKKGWGWGITTFGFTILWSILFLAVGIAFAFFFSQSVNPYATQ